MDTIQRMQVDYPRKQYYETFMSKNDEKIHKKEFCDICFGSYTYFGKSRHNKSKKHLQALEIRAKQNTPTSLEQ
jgi:hypothetical protein